MFSPLKHKSKSDGGVVFCTFSLHVEFVSMWQFGWYWSQCPDPEEPFYLQPVFLFRIGLAVQIRILHVWQLWNPCSSRVVAEQLGNLMAGGWQSRRCLAHWRCRDIRRRLFIEISDPFFIYGDCHWCFWAIWLLQYVTPFTCSRYPFSTQALWKPKSVLEAAKVCHALPLETGEPFAGLIIISHQLGA